MTDNNCSTPENNSDAKNPAGRPPSGKLKVCSIFGTRPEAVKMGPVVLELLARPEIDHTLVVTGQHRSMLDQMLRLFSLDPDYDLDIMSARQTLTQVTTRIIEGMEKVFAGSKPDIVLVHGDTTTSFAGALAAYYARVEVGHVEAGLRTGDRYNPYPEEMNRHLIDTLCEVCLAPTATARAQLIKENFPPEKIYVTGNTVIDALLRVSDMPPPEGMFDDVPDDAEMILVEAHRRENWGRPMRDICLALKDIVEREPRVHIVFPVHLNPNVSEPAHEILGSVARVHLIGPQDYLPFVFLMKRAKFILTDSGGIQEEAPSLGTPVLVLRKCTERPEAVEAGTARLTGPDREKIVAESVRLLEDAQFYKQMATAANPYGDGKAAGRIADALLFHFGINSKPPAEFEL